MTSFFTIKVAHLTLTRALLRTHEWASLHWILPDGAYQHSSSSRILFPCQWNNPGRTFIGSNSRLYIPAMPCENQTQAVKGLYDQVSIGDVGVLQASGFGLIPHCMKRSSSSQNYGWARLVFPLSDEQCWPGPGPAVITLALYPTARWVAAAALLMSLLRIIQWQRISQYRRHSELCRSSHQSVTGSYLTIEDNPHTSQHTTVRSVRFKVASMLPRWGGVELSSESESPSTAAYNVNTQH